jgi:predicted metal-binding protein
MESEKIPYRTLIFVCTNARGDGKRVSCADPGRDGALIRDRLKDEAAKRGLKGVVRVSATGCLDVCEKGPNVMVLNQE